MTLRMKKKKEEKNRWTRKYYKQVTQCKQEQENRLEKRKNEKSLMHPWDYKKKNLTSTSSVSQEGQEK